MDVFGVRGSCGRLTAAVVAGVMETGVVVVGVGVVVVAGVVGMGMVVVVGVEAGVM